MIALNPKVVTFFSQSYLLVFYKIFISDIWYDGSFLFKSQPTKEFAKLNFPSSTLVNYNGFLKATEGLGKVKELSMLKSPLYILSL